MAEPARALVVEEGPELAEAPSRNHAGSETDDFPMVLAEVTVASVERISTSFVRAELASPELAEFGVDGPLLDQRIKLVLPAANGQLPPISRGPTWYSDWAALPDDVRGHVRTYTVREVRGTGPDRRVVVDIVVHPGDTGPGSRWAAAAQPGDRVALLGPRRGYPFGGIEFAPGAASRLLIAGDETALPAIAGILAGLPADASGTAYVEIPHEDDAQDLAGPPGVQLVWLPRNGRPHGARLCQAVLTLFDLPYDEDLPTDVDPDLWETPSYSSSGEPLAQETLGEPGLYAWVAGESRAVTKLRRHLVNDAGLDRRQVAFMGYWRLGVAMKS